MRRVWVSVREKLKYTHLIQETAKKLPVAYIGSAWGCVWRIGKTKRGEWEKATYPSSLVWSPPPVHLNMYIPHLWACELSATPRGGDATF